MTLVSICEGFLPPSYTHWSYTARSHTSKQRR